MKSAALATLVMAVSIAGGTADAAFSRLTVRGDRVCLRAGPDDQTEVVAQVSDGEVLAGTGREEGEWIQVIPPASVSLWVYGELVQDSLVSASKVRVRSGPGISYRPVGTLDKGQPLSVRSVKGEWVEVAPPPGSYLWISRIYLAPDEPSPRPKPEVPSAPASAPPPPAAPAGRPAIAVGPPPKPEVGKTAPSPSIVSAPVVAHPREEPVSVPPVLAGKRLAPGKEAGLKVECAGVLRGAGLLWRRPSRYRLVQDDGTGRSVTRCYVLGNESQLGSIVGRSLVIHGREYWLDGVRYPVLIPDQIVRRN